MHRQTLKYQEGRGQPVKIGWMGVGNGLKCWYPGNNRAPEVGRCQLLCQRLSRCGRNLQDDFVLLNGSLELPVVWMEKYNYLTVFRVMTDLARAIGLEEPIIDAPMNGIPWSVWWEHCNSFLNTTNCHLHKVDLLLLICFDLSISRSS